MQKARRRLPFAVIVENRSMLPTLRPGDCLVVRRPGRTRPGQVVVARFATRPELLVVKRAVRQVDGGWWLASDNPLVADDSRKYGAAEVVGLVVLRYWPLPLTRVRRRRGDPARPSR